MGRAEHFWERLADAAQIGNEPLPGETVVEIAGTRRVLIENHLGVSGYNSTRVLVHVKFGWICVSGCNLELLHMTKTQLVIRGQIDGVSLQGRNAG